MISQVARGNPCSARSKPKASKYDDQGAGSYFPQAPTHALLVEALGCVDATPSLLESHQILTCSAPRVLPIPDIKISMSTPRPTQACPLSWALYKSLPYEFIFLKRFHVHQSLKRGCAARQLLAGQQLAIQHPILTTQEDHTLVEITALAVLQ